MVLERLRQPCPDTLVAAPVRLGLEFLRKILIIDCSSILLNLNGNRVIRRDVALKGAGSRLPCHDRTLHAATHRQPVPCGTVVGNAPMVTVVLDFRPVTALELKEMGVTARFDGCS
ncbi:MAG: hypothetical protein DWQ34_09480 [Planctomycetota bacterium]|nr:MAG: hypothetical protein DWQ34_09480 [Planctomycetota bacterium]REK38115.1 MAG: hypothetical protein DWQ45_05605 [Planctomycetota bacterium]